MIRRTDLFGRAPPAPRDWTPIVLVVATLSLSTVGLVWVAERLAAAQAPAASEPGPVAAERSAPGEVDVWVGRQEGVTAVLSTVWGDPGPDQAHDAALREGLALEGGGSLACYSLLLFNLSDAARTVVLGEGALVLEDGAAGAGSASLRRRLESGARPSAGLTSVLKALGALDDRVELAAGEGSRVLVCFERRVDLAEARGVRFRDGTAFRARRMGRRDLQRLFTDPDEAELKSL